MRHYGILTEEQEQAIKAAMEPFSQGHPDFKDITLNELVLHSAKNSDYASGGKPTGNFDRVAAILSHYPKLKLSDPRVVALVYALKQWDAVLWGISEGIEHKVEGLNARLQDVSVYSKIVQCQNNDLARQRDAEIDRQFGVDLHALIPDPKFVSRLDC